MFPLLVEVLFPMLPNSSSGAIWGSVSCTQGELNQRPSNSKPLALTLSHSRLSKHEEKPGTERLQIQVDIAWKEQHMHHYALSQLLPLVCNLKVDLTKGDGLSGIKLNSCLVWFKSKNTFLMVWTDQLQELQKKRKTKQKNKTVWDPPCVLAQLSWEPKTNGTKCIQLKANTWFRRWFGQEKPHWQSERNKVSWWAERVGWLVKGVSAGQEQVARDRQSQWDEWDRWKDQRASVGQVENNNEHV